MRWPAFQTRVPGKWVLSGEHAVLQGETAVALPHPELSLTLRFEPSGRDWLEVVPEEVGPLIRAMLPPGVGIPGRLTIESTVPPGAGLGSSAALCVALTRWLAGPLGLPASRWVDFATRMEHRFHGTSSGMDVAVVSAGEPVLFSREKGARPLGVRRLPRFSFHDTGLRARTSDCVSGVTAYHRAHPREARLADEEMGLASRESAEGLKAFDSGNKALGLDLLARAMSRAHGCFERWDLVPPEAHEIRRQLFAQGALAAKLTGAGGGGMVVALWPRERISR